MTDPNASRPAPLAQGRDAKRSSEVSSTTLVYAREPTASSYYARVGPPECWVLDLAGGRVPVIRTAASAGDWDVRTLRRGAVVKPGVLESIELSVEGVLGPGAV